MTYIGRFAPSPTGPLHAGSLLAAVASYLDARHHDGRWLLRIDDIDPPRAVDGSVTWIKQALRAHGLQPDGSPDFQSAHSKRYDSALKLLSERGHLFYCHCTRATLGAQGCCVRDCSERDLDPNHNGTATSLRIRVPSNTTIEFDDLLLGPQRFPIGAMLNNFIVKRRDGLYAYQLAAAVDDVSPGISHVIRGRDLLDSTPRQQFIQTCLGLHPPRYGHLPVLTDQQGVKLSKQTGAPALNDLKACSNLRTALAQLGQAAPPKHLKHPQDLLDFAIPSWDRKCIPK